MRQPAHTPKSRALQTPPTGRVLDFRISKIRVAAVLLHACVGNVLMLSFNNFDSFYCSSVPRGPVFAGRPTRNAEERLCEKNWLGVPQFLAVSVCVHWAVFGSKIEGFWWFVLFLTSATS